MAELVNVTNMDALERAARALFAGHAIVVPTETVYGLAVLPSVPGAVETLFEVKGRPKSVPVAVLVDGIEQAHTVAELSVAGERLAARLWPGPLTLVLARRPGLELHLGGGDDTIGVRCPAHAFLRTLARQVGPMATTSANRHGETTAATAREVAAALGDGVALVVDGGPCDGVPSTVVDVTGAEPKILRAGAIPEDEIARALG